MVGARPQFIKAAAVSRPLRQHHHEILVHTGQHYDDAMSDQFFRELDLPQPDVELGVGSGSHGVQTGGMLIGIEAEIERHRPDALLVYGDTNSTLAGALAAAKAGVPVAHVEAGLRSFNRQMPEEINRVISDRLSTLLLCPSALAALNLAAEGITTGVHVIGDVMADVLAHSADAGGDADVLAAQALWPGQYFVATIHRAANTADAATLRRLFDGFSQLDAPVMFPAHPRVTNAIARFSVRVPANVRTLPPVGYRTMMALVRNARAVLTDSGGLQKEAYWLGVPCITLREETEWTETVAAGWNVLTGSDPERIVAAAAVTPPSHRPELYGDGHAAERVVALIETLQS